MTAHSGDSPRLNPFEDPSAAEGYEAWYDTVGQRADRLEKGLLKRLLGAFPGTESVLEVGCGTGHFTRWFATMGKGVIGLDLSSAMLREAARAGTPACLRGDALELPFRSHAFDVVAMITTLEFTTDPLLALREALRVARRGLLLGVLNGKSGLGRRLKQEGGPIWSQAQLLGPCQLMRKVRQAAQGKGTMISWRTTLWPGWPGPLPLPWGGFIGMAVRLS